MKHLDTSRRPTYYKGMDRHATDSRPTLVNGSEHRMAPGTLERRCVRCGHQGALLLIPRAEAVRLGLAEDTAAWACLLDYFNARDECSEIANGSGAAA